MRHYLFRGFSLIEMVIVVAIIAIIAAIAMPNYQSYVLRTNRAVGKAELMKVASRQEQYFVNNKTYTNDLTQLGYPATYYLNDNGGSQASSSGSIYQITLATANGGLEYTVTATPRGRQTKDTDCGTLAVDEQGKKYQNNGSTAATDKCW